MKRLPEKLNLRVQRLQSSQSDEAGIPLMVRCLLELRPLAYRWSSDP